MYKVITAEKTVGWFENEQIYTSSNLTCDLEEAEFMATDLLAGYLSWLEEDGKEIPNPSKEESVEVSDILNLLDIGETEAFVKMVSIRLSRSTEISDARQALRK